MDKIKPYLLLLKKYHFWILAVATLLAGFVVRQQAGSAISAATQTQESKLKNSFSQTDQLAANREPKTPAHADVYAKAHTQLKANAEEGFAVLRDPIQREAPFKWPKLKTNKLPDYMAEFLPKRAPKEEMKDNLREEYENYMKLELPRILAVGNVLRQERTDGGPFAGEDEDAAKAAPTETRGVMEWAAEDREAFEKHFDFKETPTTDQILLLQENYWLYESLLKSLAGVNVQAKGPYDAVISKINTLAIAQRALSAWAQTMPTLTGPTKEGGQAGTAQGLVARKPAPNLPQPGDPANVLEQNRYIDDLGAPLPNKAATKTPQFTYVPVYLELVMNQQKVAELTAALHNSVLPVYVTQIALNDSLTGGGSTISGGGSPAPSSGGGGGGLGRGLLSRGSRSSTTTTTAVTRRDAASDRKRPNDILVQIAGVMMIANPPPPQPTAPGATPAAPGAPPVAAAPAGVPAAAPPGA